MNKTDNYQEQLNRLEQQLPPSDAQYFQDLRRYLLTKDLFKSNEQILTQQLLTMLQDFLDASHHGETAPQFFGNNPAALADDILAELPRNNRRQQFQFIGLLVLISWFFILLNAGTATGIRLNWLLLFAIPLVEITAILIIFKIMNHAIYTANTPFKQETLPVVLVTTLTLIILIGCLLIAPRFSSWAFIFLPNPWGLGIQITQLFITLSWLGANWFLARRQNSKH
ncbi:hypothetical protein N7X57_12930 [Lactiplantibacillus paraplantarum]|uniref:hypothetical protein n=1 Tax=Lactiplantibacillus paraplantarum TaxID=60520 RepID=UPI0005144D1D|nr:hypothetical protein [Lactiplantibacillus paraplantarum]OAX74865.1 hypothetical protein A0U96_11115 [Lactiplantibacillus plantarum]ALO05115.1 hypothetical protein ASU28_12495 [Lactiplantibacillus paraplantarum]KGE75945.1 membrane protein [Lactiplantibacillus paraplantarum]MCW1911328.1 hypothetical protein [Lactiplantibacillus paraplantarum]RDG09816.1 hypothetical protein DQM08_12345 [Lactiplantibacillus paraplantarum]